MSRPRFSWLQLFFLAVFLTLGMVKAASGFDIAITVAPNVLNIQSGGAVVTVHTDVAYGDVYVHSVFLNDVPIQSYKADNRGNFVAKFNMEDVKYLDGLTYGGLNELTLTGATMDGDAFSGSDEVLVVDNIPKGGRN